MTRNRVRLGVSRCLLGERVRYDGQHKLNTFLRDTLGQHVDYVPVCPEVECGLPVPREPMRLCGAPQAPRLITVDTGRDLTDQMQLWIERRLPELEAAALDGFIFKSGSPSSGLDGVKLYDARANVSGVARGLFAAAFVQHFPRLPVIDEVRLGDPALARRFLEQVFGAEPGGLVWDPR